MPQMAKIPIPSRFAVLKSVRSHARGHNNAMPTQETIRLMLNEFDSKECLLTRTTEMPELAAESKANAMPIIFH
jgi:hypothetical protein